MISGELSVGMESDGGHVGDEVNVSLNLANLPAAIQRDECRLLTVAPPQQEDTFLGAVDEHGGCVLYGHA